MINMSELEDIALEKHINQFYWGLLATVYQEQLDNKANLLVLWCHYNLVRRGMTNAGLADTIPTTAQVDTDLPVGWNESLPCRMRYVHKNTLLILTVFTADDDGDIVINLTRTSDNKIAITVMNVSEISTVKGRLEEAIPNWTDIQDRLNTELIDPLIKNATNKPCLRPPYLLSSPYGLPKPKALPRPRSIEFFMDSVLGVGSSDLNPLGGRGQQLGMAMGSSFTPDPICPSPLVLCSGRSRGRSRRVIQPDGRPGPRGNYPDPDHRPPPGYDDMF